MDGFNTFEKQDKVLLGLNSGSDAAHFAAAGLCGADIHG